MFQSGLAAIVIAYLPGAILFRLPLADRDRRAALDAEERLFWHVVLSLAWSLSLVLGLAVVHAYRFDRLVAINAIGSAVLVVTYRGRLRMTAAGALRWTAVLPLVLLALGAWRFFPSAEYLIGGRDPGTYMNEGVQISQRGSIVSLDGTVARVPAAARPLFFGEPGNGYAGERFIAFYVQDFSTGQTIGQFPHLFPASIALGYDVNGLTGARAVVGLWAMLGIVAVYFAGARLVGRAAAFAAGVLLVLHVIEVWFGRYPNSEVLMQAFGFAAVLAFARAHQDGDAFFGPVAGVLATTLIFARVDALMIVAALVAAAILGWLLDRRPLRAGFFIAVAAGSALALWYLAVPMRAYFWRPLIYLEYMPMSVKIGGAALAVIGMALLAWLRRRGIDRHLRPLIPILAVAGMTGAAVYAYFWREPGGRLTVWDAKTLRMFTDFYLQPVGLIAAVAGFGLIARRSLWRDPALFVLVVVFSVFFFFKIQATPEQFWMARRFVPVILPAALLFAAAAAFVPLSGSAALVRRVQLAVGLLVLIFLGRGYLQAAEAVVSHVEYAGLAPKLERLAARFTDRDLVLVDSRNSDANLFAVAVPLANIYARHVLVLQSPTPDHVVFEAFLRDALAKYDRVFFLSGGGSEVLSRHVVASPEGGDRVRVPEFEHTSWDVLPEHARRKDFDYAVYRLALGNCNAVGGFTLDVGFEDDLNVLRFGAKEQPDGGARTIRWTGELSHVSVPCLAGSERTVSLVMHDGGRSPKATPARVDVRFNDVPIGTIHVGHGFQTYRLDLPAELAQQAAALDAPVRLSLRSTVWIPRDFVGGTDDRKLGVMLDRVEVK